ncbi:hypothetical protein [Streptomyces sp. NPDC001389]|uniref:hypothetical protein n=1 Tax=Streptomyces sp. NPDC001389 TaxID=3364569 RepID=UPI00367B34F7
MGAIRSSATTLLSAGAAGLALALGAPVALAAEAAPVTSFAFAVTPSTVAPGGTVTLSVSNCAAAFATASSGVFDTVTIERGKTVEVRVDRDARPGALYSVTFTCNGENGSADLTISGGTTMPSTSSTSGPRRTPSPTATTGTGLRPPPFTTPPTRTTVPARTTPPTRTTQPVQTTQPVRTTQPARTTPPARATTAPRATTATLGVRGGLGGSIAGADPLELAVGAFLFAAAAGGTAYALRRRRATRGH